MTMSYIDTAPEDLTAEDCLDYHNGGDDGAECKGKVEYRMSLTGTGTSIPRCDGHWDKRLKLQDEINDRYPDSPLPPAWFDPMDAGEHWDSDY